MALPYLPAEYVVPVLEQISSRELSPNLSKLVDYINRQWMMHTTFTPVTWSVFKRPFRTNNDVEGWHTRFNVASNNSAGLNFYKIVSLLHDEAATVTLTRAFISEGVVLRRQRKLHKNIHKKINKAWDSLLSKDISAEELLWKCSHFCNPRIPIFRFVKWTVETKFCPKAI